MAGAQPVEPEPLEESAPVVRRVRAALVEVRVGGKVQHLYHGDVLPPDVDKDSLANLEALGFITKD